MPLFSSTFFSKQFHCDFPKPYVEYQFPSTMNLQNLISGWVILFFLNKRDKDDFVREYHQAQGIVLDRACRAKNSVQNAPATLTLNSTRGRKWAKNEKKTHTTLVTIQCEH